MVAHVDGPDPGTVCREERKEEPAGPHRGHRAERGLGRLLREDGQDPCSPLRRSPGAAAHVLTALPSSGLSVPNVHGALAPLAIPSAAAAAAAAGRIAIPGLAGAGNSVLLVSNLNPEVRASSFQAVVPRSTSGAVTVSGSQCRGQRAELLCGPRRRGLPPRVVVPLCADPLTAAASTALGILSFSFMPRFTSLIP